MHQLMMARFGLKEQLYQILKIQIFMFIMEIMVLLNQQQMQHMVDIMFGEVNIEWLITFKIVQMIQHLINYI
jgi:hypothetical protein